MQWGNDLLEWLASNEGWRVLSGAIIPALAIIVAGVIAGLIGRGSTKRVIAQYNRDALTAAVQGLVLAGRKAASWNALGTVERVQVDHLIGEAETRIRLLPVAGAALAANWAAHQLEDMKRNSAGFSFQAQQTLAEYRDRLIAWSEKPRSAKKLFGADLERWKYEADPSEQALIAEQAQWEAQRTPERESAAVTPSIATATVPAASGSRSPEASPANRSTDEPPVTPPSAGTPLVVSTPFAPSLTSSTSSTVPDVGLVETEAYVTEAYLTEAQRSRLPASPSNDEAPAPLSAWDVRDRTDRDEDR